MLKFRAARRLLTLAAALGLGAALPAGCDDGPAVVDDGATCSELGQQAREEGLDVMANAQRSCADDSDCVVSNQHPRCTDPCGFQTPINIPAITEVQAYMLDIEAEYCEEFERKNCSINVVPCIAMGPVHGVCRDGQCESEPDAREVEQ